MSLIGNTDEKLIENLVAHEGYRTMPYTDTVGKLTIGVGRNLTDRGLSKEEVYFLLANDIKRACGEIDLYFPWVWKMTENRQRVMIELTFAMGITKIRGFKRMLLAAASGHYADAAIELLNSRWAEQVGERAHALAQLLELG
jgi:lysozyme